MYLKNNQDDRNLPEYAKRQTWTLSALTKLLSRTDFDIKPHSERLIEPALLLGRRVGLSGQDLADLRLFALFHDLGKAFLPGSLLFKKEKLTPKEWEVIKLHSEIGARFASIIGKLNHVSDYILKHHERWDGQGYPLGISGLEIPLFCRILHIVDTWDAMVNERPYKNILSYPDAIAEMEANAGLQFDPTLFEIWRNM